VADAARQVAEELAEERTVEAGKLRRQLSAIPPASPQPSADRAEQRNQQVSAAGAQVDGKEDEGEDYTQKDPLLRALRRPQAEPLVDQRPAADIAKTAATTASDAGGEAGAQAGGAASSSAAPMGLIERLQKARSALQPSQGPIAPGGSGGSSSSATSSLHQQRQMDAKENRPPASSSGAPGSKIPSLSPRPPASPPAASSRTAAADSGGGDSPSHIPVARQKKGKLVRPRKSSKLFASFDALD
jgi:hypothetical protein